MAQRIVIPDTSVVNHLIDDPDFEALKAGIKAGVYVHIPETVIGELVAAPDALKRSRLLKEARSLVANGQFIHSFAVLTKRMLRAFDSDPARFNWKEIPIQFSEAGSILAREQISDELAEAQRKQAQALADEWAEPFDRMRVDMEKVINERGVQRPPLDEMITGFIRQGGSMWIWAKMLYQRDDRSEPDEQTVLNFVNACPPFRTMLVALVITQYERAFRDLRVGESLRGGRCDTLMSFYLPYCDIFLTDDAKHKALFLETVKHAHQPCEVMSLGEFKKRFMPSII